MKRNQWRQLVMVCVPAVSLYVAALLLPAADLRGETFSGTRMLVSGALALIFGLPATGAWLLNPLFLIALVLLLLGLPRGAFWFAILGLLLGYLFTMSAKILFSLPWDEGGGRANIEQVHLGFWLWLAAPALVTVGAGLEAYMRGRDVVAARGRA